MWHFRSRYEASHKLLVNILSVIDSGIFQLSLLNLSLFERQQTEGILEIGTKSFLNKYDLVVIPTTDKAVTDGLD